MTGDLIYSYLAELKATLRTPPERTAEILAEAEDHLRESAATGVAIGMTQREAQEAASSARPAANGRPPPSARHPPSHQ